MKLQDLFENTNMAGYTDVLKKHGFTKKNGYWISDNKKAGKVSFNKNGEWKLSGASIDGMVDDYEGTIAGSLDKHLSKITEADSNLVIQWKPASPSDKAYLKRIGLTGNSVQMASVEDHTGEEIDYAKVDGKRYRINYDKDTFVAESKNHMGETEYSSFASWKAAVKKHFPNFWIDGDKEIASAMIGPKPFKKGETKSVGEWDGETGVVYSHVKV